MRIRMLPEITDRRSLKPAVSDTVVYEGTEYVVTQVGMRYLHAYRKDDPKKFNHILKVVEVVKKELQSVPTQAPASRGRTAPEIPRGPLDESGGVLGAAPGFQLDGGAPPAPNAKGQSSNRVAKPDVQATRPDGPRSKRPTTGGKE